MALVMHCRESHMTVFWLCLHTALLEEPASVSKVSTKGLCYAAWETSDVIESAK